MARTAWRCRGCALVLHAVAKSARKSVHWRLLGVSMLIGNLGLLQHHIRGLNHYGNRIADLQIHFFHAAARNYAFDLVFAHRHDHVSHQVADLQFFDLAYQAVACRNSHAGMIPCAREPVEAEIARENKFAAALNSRNIR
jgi:hypothetical protein